MQANSAEYDKWRIAYQADVRTPLPATSDLKNHRDFISTDNYFDAG